MFKNQQQSWLGLVFNTILIIIQQIVFIMHLLLDRLYNVASIQIMIG